MKGDVSNWLVKGSGMFPSYQHQEISETLKQTAFACETDVCKYSALLQLANILEVRQGVYRLAGLGSTQAV